jgi:hypothetical protein
MACIRIRPSSSTDWIVSQANCWLLRRACSKIWSYVAAIRARIVVVSNRYNGSIETTAVPRRVDSALKLAGPSAQLRILRPRSASLRTNIRATRTTQHIAGQGTLSRRNHIAEGRVGHVARSPRIACLCHWIICRRYHFSHEQE